MPTYDDSWAIDWLIDKLEGEWERRDMPASESAAPTETAPEGALKGA